MSPNYMNYMNYRNYMVTLSVHLIESILSTLFIITKKKKITVFICYDTDLCYVIFKNNTVCVSCKGKACIQANNSNKANRTCLKWAVP